MEFSLSDLSAEQTYFLMTQTLVPRPIAWILSRHENGLLNLAPFSYFSAVSSAPPVVLFSVGLKSDGSPKDTRLNVLQRHDFVVHIPSQAAVSLVNKSADEFPQDVSELNRLGLKTEPFGRFSVPRISDCPVALACVYRQDVVIGSQCVIFAEVNSVYVCDDAVSEVLPGRYQIDAKIIDPLARLGGQFYSGLGELISRPRNFA